MSKIKINRRQFLGATLLSGGSLLLSPFSAEAARPFALDSKGQKHLLPGPWIQIHPDNRITLIISSAEMGQGVTVSQALLIAEELDADWEKIETRFAPVNPVYANPMMRSQTTGGSMSMPSSWEPLREAGAAARQLMINAAAKLWGLPASELKTAQSQVWHQTQGKVIAYGDLIEVAASLPLPYRFALKRHDQYQLLGTNPQDPTSLPKAQGKVRYASDVQLPGMKIALVIHPPVHGAKPQQIRSEKALAVPGVLAVEKISTGVAVVAKDSWSALQGAKVLEIQWNPASATHREETSFWLRWAEKAQSGEITPLYDEGQAEQILAQSKNRLSATYKMPYQAHATQEPMCAVAHVQEDSCEIWAGTQALTSAHEVGMRFCGLSADQVQVHNCFLGGGFGRRGYNDFVAEAVELSLIRKEPIKVFWNREEDFKKDYYRPASLNLLDACWDDSGQITAWKQVIVGPDLLPGVIDANAASLLPDWFGKGMKQWASDTLASLATRFATGVMVRGGHAPLIYPMPNQKLDFILDDPGMPVGFWRAVNYSTSGIVVEGFLDEIAAASGQDPLEIRRKHLPKDSKFRDVLEMAVKYSNWGKPLPPQHYLGLAVHEFHNTPIALVAEIELGDQIRVKKATCAIHCGQPIHPKGIEKQVESAIAFGLTALVKSKATMTETGIAEGNFHEFPLLRLDEMPEVKTFIVESNEPPTGVGEAAVTVIGPAVLNALFAATRRPWRGLLPLTLTEAT